MLKRYLLGMFVVVALAAPAAKADLYAAISYSNSTGRWGYSFDKWSLSDATWTANAECGVYDCTVKSWVRNGCTALARGYGGALGWAYDNSLAYAQVRAVNECSIRDYGCAVIVWACTSGHL